MNEYEQLSISEQAEDAAFQEQNRRECSHVWEKVTAELLECEICGESLSLYQIEAAGQENGRS